MATVLTWPLSGSLKSLLTRKPQGARACGRNPRLIQTWGGDEEAKRGERGPSQAPAASPSHTLILDTYPRPPHPRWLCGVHTFRLPSVPQPRSGFQPRRNAFDSVSSASGEAVLSDVQDVIPSPVSPV